MSQSIEYTKDGRVIIPLMLWNQIKELAEYIYLEEIIRTRAKSEAVIPLERLIEEEGLSREELES